MKNFYKFIILSLMVIILTSCQTIVDGISMKKKNNTDQFLIEKKSPLVLPPDFDELPEPASEAKSSEEEEFDLKNVLGQTSASDENKKTDSSSIKNTIMKKIK